MKNVVRLFAAVALVAASLASVVVACTGITIKAKDGAVVYARTLEFAADLQSNIIVIPRGTPFVGSAPNNEQGLKWTTKYGVVGANGFDMPITVDGLNEKGLAIGLFYFPGYAQYQETQPAFSPLTLAPWELGTYLLTTCSTVQEAVDACGKVRVEDVVQKQMGAVPPVHYVVSDAKGNCVVLEYIGGELKVHKNPLGVVTNSPAFDWHLINLSNYINESVTNVPPVDVDGFQIPSLGQGSGMLGLPGDFTPPSRFVRAVVFSKTALPVATAREAVLQAFHLLNNFDIPKGAARGTENGQMVADYTMWTAASDLTNLRYYFRTFDNSQIRMIDFKKVNFDADHILTISMKGEEIINDVSLTAK